MPRLYVTLMCFFAALFSPSAASAEDGQPGIEPLRPMRVGVILPLSGDAASVGDAIRNGFALGLEKLSPEARARLEIVYEDDALDPKRTITAYRRLVAEKGGLDVIVNASSGTAKALAPVIERHNIPLIALATDPEVVVGRNWSVNFWVTPEEQVRMALPEALRRGYKRIARVTTIHDFTLAIKRTFDEQNQDAIEVVLDEEFPSDVKDFKPFLARLRGESVDAVLVALMPGQLGIFAKQVRAAGMNPPLFGFETFEDSGEVQTSNGALVGHWYVNNDDPNQSFLRDFRKRFPQSSLYGASNGHDIALLLGSAAEQNILRSADINLFLHSLKDFSGVLGTYSSTPDNRFTLPAAVKVVTENGFEKVSATGVSARESESPPGA